MRPVTLRLRAFALLLVTGMSVMGCNLVAPVPLVAPPAPPPVAAPPPPSAASQAARIHYAQVQQQLLSQGMLRTDAGGPDTPFTDRMLADNFVRIALYDEYAREGGTFVQRETSSQLRRWDQPVRVGLFFGGSVPAERQATDRARVASYLARLSQLTRHPIALSDTPNFWIYIVNEEERQSLGSQVRAALPGVSAADVSGITEMPRSTYCLVYAMTERGRASYGRAFAVIRAEHPDLLRLSCIHEEVAQGLGLANDSPRARPSIFNDDEEFALLTTQDELMLRMLYDPALRPGMTEIEARPIVETLASRLLGGGS